MIKYILAIFYAAGSIFSIILTAKLTVSNDPSILSLFFIASALFLLPVALIFQSVFALAGRHYSWGAFTIILPTILYPFSIPYAVLLSFLMF